MKTRDANIAAVDAVAAGLGPLLNDVTFVGGAVASFYIDDPAAGDARATQDVDCIVHITSHAEFADFESKLRGRGFKHDVTEGAPICRWQFAGLLVDVMPTDTQVLGFSNRWYAPAVIHRAPYETPSGVRIYVLPLAYFLATKLEAIKTRGARDWAQSRDLEDVVAIIDGKLDIAGQIAATQGELRAYLQGEFRLLLAHPERHEIFCGHLPPDSQNESRARRVAQILEGFCGVTVQRPVSIGGA